MTTSSTTGRPEPVLDAAKLAAAVSGTVLSIGAIFVLVGWVTADQVQNWAVIAGGIVTSVGALLAVAMPIITALGARAQVTPLAAPVGVDGVPLITTAAPPNTAPTTDDRDIAQALHDLDQPGYDGEQPADLTTRPIPAVPAWLPPTPAAAAEPTPIGAEAEAAATGRQPAAV